MYPNHHELDLNRPLWEQVSCLTNDEYENICNKPIIYGDTAYTYDYSKIKLYQHAFFNQLMQSSLLLCYMVWIPYVYHLHTQLTTICTYTMLVGVASWYIYAYWFHRFHHSDISNKYANSYYKRLWHFNGHGYHHICPHDYRRIVIHPIIASIVLFPHGILTYCLMNNETLSFQTGLVIGHMLIETSHYSVHYFTLLTPFIRQLKNHHLSHHYKLPHKLFAYGHKMEDKVWTKIVGDIEHIKTNKIKDI